jgi:hypothetical protein
MRRKILIVATALAILAVPSGLAAYVLWFDAETDRLGGAIDKLGFFPITPPTLLRSPGSIYHITRNIDSISPICEAEPARLEQVLKRSATEAMVSRELRKASYGVGAELARQVQSSAEAEMLQSISLEFDKVSVLEVSLEKLAEIAGELQERPICQTEILKYLSAGDYVCQVQTVLLASAAYTVSRQASARGSGKIDTEALHGAIKANFDPTAEVIGDLKVAGEGLYYGMKFTPRCFAMIGEPPPRLPMRWHERLRRRVGLFS